MSVGKAWPFRSPIAKLLRFFRRSRDQWKAKCKKAKGENKSLKYCLAKMKQKRDRWKAEAKALQKSVREEQGSAESGAKNTAEHGYRGRQRTCASRARRRRPARLGVARAR